MTKKGINPLLVIVTGVSGAGRSVAIKSLEDNDFFCIDNLPVDLFRATAEFIKRSSQARHAIGMDIRDEKFIKSFYTLKDELSSDIDVEVVFLTASDEVLARRYQTTRRKHPLLDTGGDLLTAIKREKALLSQIEKNADMAFDTSSWSPHYLSRIIEERFTKDHPRRNLFVSITSFGFKYGGYRDADSVFDVRFLDNPHFVNELREKSGLNQAVRDYIFKDSRTQEFIDKLIDLHRFLLPNYFAEGKHYFRIGIGCTGGKHRSVCLAEELAKRLTELNLANILVSVSHRDLNEFSPLVLR